MAELIAMRGRLYKHLMTYESLHTLSIAAGPESDTEIVSMINRFIAEAKRGGRDIQCDYVMHFKGSLTIQLAGSTEAIRRLGALSGELARALGIAIQESGSTDIDGALSLARLGNELLEAKSPKAAENAFRKALHKDPSCVVAWMGLSAAHLEQYHLEQEGSGAYGSLQKAEEYALKAVEIAGDHPAPWVGFGVVLSVKGEREDALRCIDRAISMDPRHGPAWLNKGVQLHNTGQSEEALRALSVAISLGDPAAPGIYDAVQAHMNKSISKRREP